MLEFNAETKKAIEVAREAGNFLLKSFKSHDLVVSNTDVHEGLLRKVQSVDI